MHLLLFGSWQQLNTFTGIVLESSSYEIQKELEWIHWNNPLETMDFVLQKLNKWRMHLP